MTTLHGLIRQLKVLGLLIVASFRGNSQQTQLDYSFTTVDVVRWFRLTRSVFK